jgi:hypothetical protein
MPNGFKILWIAGQTAIQPVTLSDIVQRLSHACLFSVPVSGAVPSESGRISILNQA